MRNSRNPYWLEMRRRLGEDEFARTVEKIEATDPARFLPLAKASVLVQCARLETPDNVSGCPKVHELAGGEKRLVWYDDDHHFTSLEATRDRLQWLEERLSLRKIGTYFRQFVKMR